MKKILALFLLVFGSLLLRNNFAAYAVMINNYAVNPAIAGMHDYYQVS